MGVLQRFERRLDHLVNGAFARAFKADVQPVEIASALQRECDDRAAIVAAGRTMVPNRFIVELGPRDYERLATYAEPLGAELAGMVSEHAREQHYSFVGPVAVRFAEVADLDTGLFRVRALAEQGPQPAPQQVAPSRRSDDLDDPFPTRTADLSSSGTGGPTTPSWLEVGGERHLLTSPVTTLGRGSEADVRIEDLGVSRRHCEIRPGRAGRDGGDLVIVDLGSTNGTVIDGQRVNRAVLRDGARIILGGTEIRYRRPAVSR